MTTRVASTTGGRWKHGHARRGLLSATYRSWRSMLGRCRGGDPRYAGRVQVCERWRDFRSFLADVGPRPAGATLDRISGDGHYELGNVRWASRATQARNTRANKLTPSRVAVIRKVAGALPQSVVAEAFGIARQTVSKVQHRERWREPISGRRDTGLLQLALDLAPDLRQAS